MKLSKTGYLLITSFLVSCDPASINGGYHDLGSFNTRVEAQNRAIADILKNYGSLPENSYYKVKYSFRNQTPTAPTGQSEHALWYNKNETQLALEVDVNSGVVCRWTSANRSLLDQASKKMDGMALIDSLGKPNQPIAQCQ